MMISGDARTVPPPARIPDIKRKYYTENRTQRSTARAQAISSPSKLQWNVGSSDWGAITNESLRVSEDDRRSFFCEIQLRRALPGHAISCGHRRPCRSRIL